MRPILAASPSRVEGFGLDDRCKRGTIDRLPSGAYRVRVYAGTDPVSGKRHDLVGVVAAGPRAAAEAEKARRRLLSQLDERRNPRTKATVNQLLDRFSRSSTSTTRRLDDSTRKTYIGYLDRHVRRVLGNQLLSKVEGEVLDALNGQLRRCRARCNGRSRAIEHRTQVAHECVSAAHAARASVVVVLRRAMAASRSAWARSSVALSSSPAASARIASVVLDVFSYCPCAHAASPRTLLGDECEYLKLATGEWIAPRACGGLVLGGPSYTQRYPSRPLLQIIPLPRRSTARQLWSPVNGTVLRLGRA
jgi:hypothetical protein